MEDSKRALKIKTISPNNTTIFSVFLKNISNQTLIENGSRKCRQVFKNFLVTLVIFIFMLPTWGLAQESKRPIVGLWIPWNDLASDLSEIEVIPNNKFNWVTINFRPPLQHMDLIEASIRRFHERGITVNAFVTMEIYSELFRELAEKRGEEIPENLVFKSMLNADGSEVLKSKYKIKITSLWDDSFKDYIEKRVFFLKNAGVDYITIGELGFMMSPIRDFTEEALIRFSKEKNVTLPTTVLGDRCKHFFDNDIYVSSNWFFWKWENLYDWLSSLPVDSIARPNIRGLTPPVFENTKFGGGASISPWANECDYPIFEEKIRIFKLPEKINLGGIQYSVGNTGENIDNPEKILKHAIFLTQRLDGFEFYGSAYWKRYKQYVNYLPDLDKYEELKTKYNFDQYLHPIKEQNNNLVLNPGFEQLSFDHIPSHWVINPESTNKKDIELDSQAQSPHTGNYAIKFNGSSDKTISSSTMPINIEAGKTYLFSAWIKATNLKSGQTCNDTIKILADWRDSNNKRIALTNVVNVIHGGRNHDWVEIWQKTIAPEEATSLELSLRLRKCSGSIYFDDIFCGEALPETTYLTPPQNLTIY